MIWHFSTCLRGNRLSRSFPGQRQIPQEHDGRFGTGRRALLRVGGGKAEFALQGKRICDINSLSAKQIIDTNEAVEKVYFMLLSQIQKERNGRKP
ncbi:MAG: hypothetical protein IKI42_10940 [Clostridia bacterium]|nr:hypothetical protein [Clostridia bacterium]